MQMCNVISVKKALLLQVMGNMARVIQMCNVISVKKAPAFAGGGQYGT